MDRAMNLTYGDLILVEIALVHYTKELDLSMQSGAYISQLLGKVEYQLAELNQAAGAQMPIPLEPNPVIPVPGN